MREIRTHGLMRGRPHRRNRGGTLYSTLMAGGNRKDIFMKDVNYLNRLAVVIVAAIGLVCLSGCETITGEADEKLNWVADKITHDMLYYST